MGAEVVRERNDCLDMRVVQPCPHCDEDFLHERKVTLPLNKAPLYQIGCPKCQRQILVQWLRDPFQFAPMAVFIRWPQEIQAVQLQ